MGGQEGHQRQRQQAPDEVLGLAQQLYPLAIQPEDLTPADLPVLFVHKHDGGKGHVGFVAGIENETGKFQTIEGNSNADESRTGGKVIALDIRTLADPKLLGLVRIA